MDNFKTIYRILSALEKSMDVEDPDWDCISAEHLGISEPRRRNLLRALFEAGYIGFAQITTHKFPRKTYFTDPHITIKGLEYLEENALIKRACKSRKCVKADI